MSIKYRFPSVRRRGVAASVLTVAALLGAYLAIPAGVGAESPTFRAHAFGKAVHTEAIENANGTLTETDISTSVVSANSARLSSSIRDEFGQTLQPKLTDKFSYGRASAFETGVGSPVSGVSTNVTVVVPDRVESAAQPGASSGKGLASFDAGGAVTTSDLRADSSAAWAERICDLSGQPMAAGRAHIVDASLLSGGSSSNVPAGRPAISTGVPGGTRSATTSVSEISLTPGTGLGLGAITSQTFAPITFFKGTSQQFTVEILGEWVLKMNASGFSGGALIYFGPRTASQDETVIRITDASGNNVRSVSFQEVVGSKGSSVTIPGVAELHLAPPPRDIDGSPTTRPVVAADGTFASAAADAVIVKLIEQRDSAGQVTFRGSEVRIGHMESKLAVPAGGIVCPGAPSQSVNGGTSPVIDVDLSKISKTNVIKGLGKGSDARSATDSSSAAGAVPPASPEIVADSSAIEASSPDTKARAAAVKGPGLFARAERWMQLTLGQHSATCWVPLNLLLFALLALALLWRRRRLERHYTQILPDTSGSVYSGNGYRVEE